jgi:hypothetical protein
VCPLAVVKPDDGILKEIRDCRHPFDDLVELTARRESGCCDVVLEPADLAGTSLQAVADGFAGKGPATICLTPGTYSLPEPLRLRPEHEHLTIEACHDGAVLEAEAGKEDAFADGLVVMDHADNVTLRGLRFHLPRAKYPTGRLRGLQSLAAAAEDLDVSIGVHPVHCAVLTVENCLFRYRLDSNKGSFGAGIFAQSECWGHRIRNNRFVRDDEYLGTRTVYGYFLADALFSGARGESVMVPALLQESEFEDNLFSGLMAGVAVFAPTGLVKLESNTVRDCHAGFVLLPPRYLGLVSRIFMTALSVLSMPQAEGVADLVASAILDPVVQVGSVLGRSYPLPEGVHVPDEVPPGTADDTADEDDVTLLTALARSMAPDQTGDGAPPTGTEPIGQPAASEILRQLGQRATEAAAGLGLPPRMFASFTAAEDVLAALRKSATKAVAARHLRMSVHLSGDDVHTRPDKNPAGFGLMAFCDPEGGGELTMVGCRYIARSGEIVVRIGTFSYVAVSGNVVINEQLTDRGTPEPSLWVAATTVGSTHEAAAITGNVLRGTTQLPPRALDAPFDTWEVLNASS